MFEILSSLLKYIFVTVIYLFIFGIIRLIYLDIRSMSSKSGAPGKEVPYLKLINRRDDLGFKVEECYTFDRSRVIGRSSGNDICIADPFLSGRHVCIEAVDGNSFIEDLGSKNGTFINGERIEGRSAPLKDGDKIHIGQLDFLFVAGKGC